MRNRLIFPRSTFATSLTEAHWEVWDGKFAGFFLKELMMLLMTNLYSCFFRLAGKNYAWIVTQAVIGTAERAPSEFPVGLIGEY